MRLVILSVPLQLALLLGGASALAQDGAALYAANCAGCHGADGQADTAAAKAMKVPPLVGVSAEDAVTAVQENPKHKALAGKLSSEELQAIAEALPAGE